MPTEFTVYQPDSMRSVGYFKAWAQLFNNMVRYRELIWQLFKRDFLATYKKTYLGYTWLFIAPLVGIVSWIILHGVGVLQPGSVGVPYPVYVLVGSSMWGLWVGIYTASAGTLLAGASIITQVKYPHEVLLVKQIAQQLANFSIGFLFNLLVLLVFKVDVTWTILLLPFVLLPLFLLGAGVGLLSSMIQVVAADLTSGLNYVMGFLLYLSPIVVSRDVQSETMKAIFQWNPLTHLICSARDIILYGRLYDVNGYIYSSVFAILVFLICWRLFFVAENRLIEKMI